MLKSPAFSTSFLESRMIQKLKSRKSCIKPGLFAFLLAERIIFGKKTQKTGENTGFSPVSFLHVLHCYLVHFGSDTWFSHLVLPVPNRSHPLQHPKRTRFRLFLAESGAFSSFLLFFWCKIFVLVFVHPAVALQTSCEKFSYNLQKRNGA